MSTMRELVDQTRSMVNGSLAEALTLTDRPYVAGSGVLALRYSARTIVPGTILSVGLNTLYVLEGDPAGVSVKVLPSYEGGPDVDVPEAYRVEIRPRHTVWRTFRELALEIEGLCGPAGGLWVPKRWTTQVDPVWETYPIPSEVGPVKRILGVRYRQPGSTDLWIDMRDWEFQPDASTGPQVIARGAPGGALIEFVAGGAVSAPTSLDESTVDLDMPPEWEDIPMLGAAATLAMSGESRRLQPFSQGDPRRADEVPATANSSLSREFRRRQKDRIDDEYAGIVNLWSWTQPMPGAR